MLSAASAHPVTFTVTDEDKHLLKELSTRLQTLSSTPNDVYLNDSGEVVYQEQKQKPVVGMIRIHLFAFSKKPELLPKDFTEKLLQIETRYKQKVRLVSQSKAKLILDEYAKEHPDINQVLCIISREDRKLFRSIDGKLSYDPFANFNQYVNARSPDLLACALDALTHPQVGEIVFYLRLFAQIEIDERSAVKDLEAKSHAELMVKLKERFKQYVQSEKLIEDIATRLQAILTTDQNHTALLDEIGGLLKQANKTCVELMRTDGARWRNTGFNGFKTLRERCRIGESYVGDTTFEQQLILSEVQNMLDTLPGTVPIVVDEAYCKVKFAIHADSLKNSYVYDLDSMLYVVQSKKIPFAKELILHISKLVDYVNVSTLLAYSSVDDLWHSSYSHRTTPLLRTIDIGDPQLFAQMCTKYLTAGSFNQQYWDQKIIYIGEVNIDPAAKKQMLEFLFSRNIEFPPLCDDYEIRRAEREKTPVKFITENPYYPLLEVACVPRLILEMGTLSPYLVDAVANLVLSYCWPEKSYGYARHVMKFGVFPERVVSHSAALEVKAASSPRVPSTPRSGGEG